MKSKTGIVTVMALAGCLVGAQNFLSSGSGSGSSSGNKGKSGNSQLKREAQLEPIIVVPATSAVAQCGRGGQISQSDPERNNQERAS